MNPLDISTTVRWLSLALVVITALAVVTLGVRTGLGPCGRPHPRWLIYAIAGCGVAGSAALVLSTAVG